MDLWKLCFLVMHCRKNRVTPPSDFMQFVGETGEVVAQGRLFSSKLLPLYFEVISIYFLILFGLLVFKNKKSKTKTPPASTPPPPPTKQNKNKQEVSFLLLLSCYQQTEKEIGGHQAFGKQSELTQLHSRLTPPTFLKFTKNQLGHAWFMLVLFQKVLFHTNSSR